MNKIIYIILVLTIVVSCTEEPSSNENDIKDSELYLDYVELEKNSIDNESEYYSAEYHLFNRDLTKSILPDGKLNINGIQVSSVKTEIVDTAIKFNLYVIFNANIDSAKIVDIVESSIINDSMYINDANGGNTIKVNCSNSKGVGFLPPYQTRY